MNELNTVASSLGVCVALSPLFPLRYLSPQTLEVHRGRLALTRELGFNLYNARRGFAAVLLRVEESPHRPSV